MMRNSIGAYRDQCFDDNIIAPLIEWTNMNLIDFGAEFIFA